MCRKGGYDQAMPKHMNPIPQEAHRLVLDLFERWHIPPHFVAELINRRASAAFTRGEVIFLQGSTADIAYWITSGLVKVYLTLPGGNRVVVRVAGPGEFLGVIDRLGTDGRRVQALEAEAMTRVSVAILTRAHVLAMLNTMNPTGLVALLEEINAAWSEMFSWCVRFLGLPFRDRLQWVFQYLASRYGVRDSRGIMLTPEISQGDLAEMIGSSRPVVSRLITEFVKRGELARQGKHFIWVDTAITAPASPRRGDYQPREIAINELIAAGDRCPGHISVPSSSGNVPQNAVMALGRPILQGAPDRYLDRRR
jgi:CRP-like cAMP-binding protein